MLLKAYCFICLTFLAPFVVYGQEIRGETIDEEKKEVSVLRTERDSITLRRPDGAQIVVEAVCLSFNGVPMSGCDEAKAAYHRAVELLIEKEYARVTPLQEGYIRHDVGFTIESNTNHTAAYFVRAFKPKEGLEFQIALPLHYEEAHRLPQKIDEAYHIIRQMANASGDPGSRIR